MSNQTAIQNPLGTEPIGKLIIKYSIPTSLTLMVNCLYNIADQIFVGQGVGITGMAATNVAFPLTIIANSIALLIGDGCAANLSLCLGRGQQNRANRTISQAVMLLLSSGITILLLSFIFAPQIIRLFGATDTAMYDALVYTRTIAFGLPFLILCVSLTAIIRADGNPQYTMKCMIAGALINVILDPIFIFVLHMGVFGAGIATVIGQAAAGSLALAYMRNLQTVRIHKEAMIPNGELIGQILKLGFPSLLTQILTAVVQIVLNNLMTIYGAMSVYGSDTALSVYGMMMKIYQIAHAMFVGLSSAIQPINGFNFGAKQYDRVRQTYKTAATIAIIISVIWFAVYQLLGRQIGMLFVHDDPVYLDCAQHIFRIFMAAFFVYGLHPVTTSFFQGIGKPGRSLMIPLFRQAIILIPLSILLSANFGLDGALIAAPIADVLVFLFSLFLALNELNNLKELKSEAEKAV